MSSSTPDVFSSPFQSRTNSSTSRVVLDDDNGTMNKALDGTDADTNKVATTDDTMKEGDDVEPDEVEKGNEKKRQKTSSIWLEFKEISLSDGSKKVECVHYKRKLAITIKNTTHFKRYFATCVQRKIYQNQ